VIFFGRMHTSGRKRQIFETESLAARRAIELGECYRQTTAADAQSQSRDLNVAVAD